MKTKAYIDRSSELYSLLKVDEWTRSDTLTNELSVCKRALSEAVDTLREEGYPIISHIHKGYKIARTPEEVEANIRWLESKKESYETTIAYLKSIKERSF